MRSNSFCLFSRSTLLIVVLLALGSLSCVPDEHDHVFDITYNPCEPLVVEPEGELRPQELESIDQALSMWNEAASLRLTRQDIDGAARIPVRFEKGAPFVNGYYSDETGEVTINRNLADPRERAITLAHELGHAFGLRHVARQKRRSLMNAGNLETGLTAGDIEELRERWQGCPAVDSVADASEDSAADSVP